MAPADPDRNPVYMVRVGRDMKVFLNLEDIAGKQANPRSHLSDVTNVQLGQDGERTESIQFKQTLCRFDHCQSLNGQKIIASLKKGVFGYFHNLEFAIQKYVS